MYQNLVFHVEDHIATIAIDRPEVMNALDSDTFISLTQAFQDCSSDPEIRAVVLTGQGRAFCAGGDMVGFQKNLSAPFDREHTYQRVLRANACAVSIRRCWKPVIAMVNGPCIGAGLSLALACDFRIISHKTKMRASFINVGLTGDTGIGFFLTEHVGLAKATEIMMLGDPILPEEAARLGLANQLVEDDALQETAYGLAKRLAKGPTAAYRGQKMMLWEASSTLFAAYQDAEAAHMTDSLGSEDFREAVTAFLGKRKPSFTGQ